MIDLNLVKIICLGALLVGFIALLVHSRLLSKREVAKLRPLTDMSVAEARAFLSQSQKILSKQPIRKCQYATLLVISDAVRKGVL